MMEGSACRVIELGVLATNSTFNDADGPPDTEAVIVVAPTV